LFNQPPPHDQLRLADPAACHLPLVDIFRTDLLPSPYYRLTLLEEAGERTRLAMVDTPSLQGIVVVHADGLRLVRLDATFGYSTYLGCVVDGNPDNFETMERIDWQVRFMGDVAFAPPWPVDPPERHLLAPTWADVPYRFDLFEAGAGIVASARIATEARPVITGPTFNWCLGQR
jgi:hypothetical protein